MSDVRHLMAGTATQAEAPPRAVAVLHGDPRANPSISTHELLSRLRIARDEAEKAVLMKDLSELEAPQVVAFLNQHAVNLAWEHRELWSDLGAADVLLRDGIGVKTVLRWMGREPGLNLNGTDLIPEILAVYEGRPVAVYGTSSPWLEAATQSVAESGCIVVSAMDGFHSDIVYLDDAREHRPALILLGMGMPKQERVARLLRAQLIDPTLIVCGGAVLDFIGGRVVRAPLWVRRADLEWLFRLVHEPTRLWSRYGPGGVRFLVRMRRIAALEAMASAAAATEPPSPPAGSTP